ncbi:MAG: hypothetical protein IH608_07285 [Proteobacteria bacterium]|nr:hypothetical protein [Pseudomonadota bacterium]
MVREKAPPGRDGGLGKYWIQLSAWGYGIYGTDFLSTVGHFLGYGCVRVGDQGMGDLYRRVREGTRVEIVYAPVKVAVVPTGEIWVEAHPDVYGKGAAGEEDVMAALSQIGSGVRVERESLLAILAEQSGLARKVGSAARRFTEADAPPGISKQENGNAALWRCLDCPPGLMRRVTLQLEARVSLDLPNPYPIEIRDDAGRVVFRPQMVAQALVHLEPGETRNFVWEVRDTEGQPLPPGSYTAVVRFFVAGEGGAAKQSLSLPLWLGN